MAEVGAGIAAADRAITERVDGAGVPFIFLIPDVQDAGPGEQMAVTSVSRGHDTVEEVDAPRHALDDISRRSDAHQITGLVLRHIFLHRLDGIVHLLVRLPYGQSADGIARQIELRDLFHMSDTKVMEHRALIDAKQHLPRIDRIRFGIILSQGGFTARQPARRARAGGFHILVRRRNLHALIKGHGDVGAKV